MSGPSPFATHQPPHNRPGIFRSVRGGAAHGPNGPRTDPALTSSTVRTTPHTGRRDLVVARRTRLGIPLPPQFLLTLGAVRNVGKAGSGRAVRAGHPAVDTPCDRSR